MTFQKARQNIAQLADTANTHKMARGLGRAVHAADFAEALDKPEAAARTMRIALKLLRISLERRQDAHADLAVIHEAEAQAEAAGIKAQ